MFGQHFVQVDQKTKVKPTLIVDIENFNDIYVYKFCKKRNGSVSSMCFIASENVWRAYSHTEHNVHNETHE